MGVYLSVDDFEVVDGLAVVGRHGPEQLVAVRVDGAHHFVGVDVRDDRRLFGRGPFRHRVHLLAAPIAESHLPQQQQQHQQHHRRQGMAPVPFEHVETKNKTRPFPHKSELGTSLPSATTTATTVTTTTTTTTTTLPSLFPPNTSNFDSSCCSVFQQQQQQQQQQPLMLLLVKCWWLLRPMDKRRSYLISDRETELVGHHRFQALQDVRDVWNKSKIIDIIIIIIIIIMRKRKSTRLSVHVKKKRFFPNDWAEKTKSSSMILSFCFHLRKKRSQPSEKGHRSRPLMKLAVWPGTGIKKKRSVNAAAHPIKSSLRIGSRKYAVSDGPSLN